MDFLAQTIPGLFLINNFSAIDSRGVFVKTFHSKLFSSIGFHGNFVESYYSQSVRNVIRGMHFQNPPHDHEKLVYVTEGSIIDVVLDLRRTSPAYGKFESFQLNAFGQSIFIPKGCAHGFKTISDHATVIYQVGTLYDATADAGVRWDSFEFDWGINHPIVSERDKNLPDFLNFETPFQ